MRFQSENLVSFGNILDKCLQPFILTRCHCALRSKLRFSVPSCCADWLFFNFSLENLITFSSRGLVCSQGVLITSLTCMINSKYFDARNAIERFLSNLFVNLLVLEGSLS